MQDTAIRLDNIGKGFPWKGKNCRGLDDFWALRGVNLMVSQGESCGIIGRNGAGKSTLLKIITGNIFPTEGLRSVRGTIAGIFLLGSNFEEQLTGRENVFLNGLLLGSTREILRDKFQEILDFSELGSFIDMPLGTYSQGMRLRLGFSIAAHLDADVFVIDEVLAVGDGDFQDKCYRKLLDLRKQGKTLVLSTQSTGLVERLCDKAVLLEHGRQIKEGAPAETVGEYSRLLYSVKFSAEPGTELVYETKKRADNIEEWGRRSGSKEVEITAVRIRGNHGISRINPGQSMEVTVDFKAKGRIVDPHFGVALFKPDGTYCYGPNTLFDGHRIKELKEGKGSFSIRFPQIFLAPSEYVLSVSIWDRAECLPFDYHIGCYRFTVSGTNINGQMCELKALLPFSLSTPWSVMPPPDIATIQNNWGKTIDDGRFVLKSFTIYSDRQGKQGAGSLFTGKSAVIEMNVNMGRGDSKEFCYWLGIFRQDKVLCWNHVFPFKSGIRRVKFNSLPLLPGQYACSLAIVSRVSREILMLRHGVLSFSMVSDKRDHGTVYLDHVWDWSLPL